jgi:transcriptional regulator with XRE-family HTH domain
MQTGREQLQAWIKRSKMKQIEAAEFLGVSDVLISQWLSGIRRPSLDLAVRLREYTGIPEGSWVLTEQNKTPEPVAANDSTSTV